MMTTEEKMSKTPKKTYERRKKERTRAEQSRAVMGREGKRQYTSTVLVIGLETVEREEANEQISSPAKRN